MLPFETKSRVMIDTFRHSMPQKRKRNWYYLIPPKATPLLKNARSVARFYGLNQAILSACIVDTASEQVFVASSEQI